jgi:hypothetical protein
VNFIDARQDWFFPPFGAFFSRERKIYFEPILKSQQVNLAARSRTVAPEAMLAGGHDRCLQVENGLILHASVVGKIPRDPARSSSQT